MAPGTVTVRLIRGDLSNNITGHPVELHVGDKVQTVNTDDQGRAEFTGLTPGTTATAVAVVDGERLESQAFPVQTQGGVRLMLVATDKEKERQKAEEAKLPPITGQVVIGGDSRIVMEPGEATISVFYILEIMNTARAPVNPATPFLFDVPRASVSTTILQGSSPLATSTGNHIRVGGPCRASVRLNQRRPRITGDPALAGICHCRNCQRYTGSSFEAVMAFPPDAVNVQGEVKTYQDTGDSGQPVYRRFCPNCGLWSGRRGRPQPRGRTRRISHRILMQPAYGGEHARLAFRAP
jgi:hypothetical protein